jgi:hypothetical protein
MTELERHGLRPDSDTTPEQLREQIHDRYLVEIRQLRDRCRAGEFPRQELKARVIELRKRYALLSVPVDKWIET